MLAIPSKDELYTYENGFLFTTNPSRMGKILLHYELLKQTVEIPGDIVEFGVFKGASFLRLAMFRNLLGLENNKLLIGFDIFGDFPDAKSETDKIEKIKFIDKAGKESISIDQLEFLLKQNGCHKNIRLISGDICQSLPDYFIQFPATRFSLINLDVDLVHVTQIILETCFDRLSQGGIIMFDDYGFFSDASDLIDTFCKDQKLQLHTSGYSKSPTYIVKD